MQLSNGDIGDPATGHMDLSRMDPERSLNVIADLTPASKDISFDVVCTGCKEVFLSLYHRNTKIH